MPSRRENPHPHLRPVPKPSETISAGPEVTLAAIEALYAFAEEPARWEDVLHAIDSLPAELDPSRDAAAAKISTHAQRAAALAEQLNEARRSRAPVAPWDAVLLSTEGRVRAIIGAADNRLSPFLSGPVQIGGPVMLRAEARNAFAAAFDAANAGSEKPLAPFTLMDEANPARLFGLVIARKAFPAELADAFGLDDVWAEPLLAMVLLSQQEQRPLDTLAQTALGLTAAEARLASKLASGLQIADASADLGISPHTARTQLKAIFAKTGARRQSELIGILGRVAAFGPGTGDRSRSAMPGPPRRFITLSDGRKLFYREYGSPKGAAVIHFHSGLAASLMSMELPNAAKGRLRILAPERPGFGQSSPCADHGFERITRDTDELAEQLGLKSIGLIGGGTGGAFALHAAIHAKANIRVLALRAPRLVAPKGGTASGFQSAMSVFIRQPWLVKSVFDIIRRGAAIPMLRAMADRWFFASASDKIRMKSDELMQEFQAQMADALEVSSAGIAAEMKLFQNVPRWDVAAMTCPVAVWIGAENPVVQVKETAALLAGARDAKIRIVPDVGIEFPRETWDEIVDWLK